jgi:predicted TIM-barrel fold metal-dependent hydrolase
MQTMINRRAFVKYCAMTGLLFPLGLAGTGRLAANISAARPVIDVHHHIVPPVYTRALAQLGIETTNGAPFPPWDAAKSIDAMDRNGIQTAITSISSPGIYFGDTRFTTDLARRCNAFSAELVAGHPARFGGYAVLPLPDLDAALNELAHALDDLKLDGVVLLSNVGGTYVGAPEFDELYAELDRRRAVVFIHPTAPFNGQYPRMSMPPSFFEFMFDTTRAVANLVQHNTLGRYPNIRFVVAHAGGAAPYLTWKMALTARVSGYDGRNVIPLLQRLYYDTALSTSDSPLGLLADLAGTDHILFGSDFPFAPEFVMASCRYELDHFDAFDAEGRAMIHATNALRLFPRFTARAADR